MQQVRSSYVLCPSQYGATTSNAAAKVVKGKAFCTSEDEWDSYDYTPKWRLRPVSQWDDEKEFSDVWAHRNELYTNQSTWYGHVRSYTGAGYLLHLPYAMDKKGVQNLSHTISKLEEDLWLDQRTRAVAHEFVLRNLLSNEYAVVTLLFETTSGGSIVQLDAYSFLTINLYNNEGTIVRLKLVCEILFLFLCAYIAWTLMVMFHKHKLRSFYSFRFVTDLILCVFVLALLVCSIMKLVYFETISNQITRGIPNNYNLRFYTLLSDVSRYVYGVVCFFVIIRVSMILRLAK